MNKREIEIEVDVFGNVTKINTNPKVGLKVEDSLHADREKKHKQFLAELDARDFSRVARVPVVNNQQLMEKSCTNVAEFTAGALCLLSPQQPMAPPQHKGVELVVR